MCDAGKYSGVSGAVSKIVCSNCTAGTTSPAGSKDEKDCELIPQAPVGSNASSRLAVRVELRLPLSASEFTRVKQENFRQAIASVLSIDMKHVRIVDFFERARRFSGGITVLTDIDCSGHTSNADYFVSKLTPSNINAELLKVNLPAAEVLHVSMTTLPEEESTPDSPPDVATISSSQISAQGEEDMSSHSTQSKALEELHVVVIVCISCFITVVAIFFAVRYRRMQAGETNQFFLSQESIEIDCGVGAELTLGHSAPLRAPGAISTSLRSRLVHADDSGVEISIFRMMESNETTQSQGPNELTQSDSLEFVDQKNLLESAADTQPDQIMPLRPMEGVPSSILRLERSDVNQSLISTRDHRPQVCSGSQTISLVEVDPESRNPETMLLQASIKEKILLGWKERMKPGVVLTVGRHEVPDYASLSRAREGPASGGVGPGLGMGGEHGAGRVRSESFQGKEEEKDEEVGHDSNASPLA